VSNIVLFDVRIKVARPLIGGHVNDELLNGGVLKELNIDYVLLF
jgi:hypothetical protein